MLRPETLIDGLRFPEGPRWHDGRLWFSDMHSQQVLAVDLDGKVETIVEVPQDPSGLGWLPDGRLLVVSMRDRKLMRLDPQTWWWIPWGVPTWATSAGTFTEERRRSRPAWFS
jgi:sugar lactone lactonase YvrE